MLTNQKMWSSNPLPYDFEIQFCSVFGDDDGMILGDFHDFARYRLSAEVSAALEFAARGSDLAPGRHDIRGDAAFALVSDYRTRPHDQLRFETHEKYIDIQYLASGTESILWAPRASLAIAEPYDPPRDVAFYQAPPSGIASALIMRPGIFAIFYPEDAHAPGGLFESEADVRKIVVKVVV